MEEPEKCMKCGFPLVKGTKYMIFEKDGEYAYMCETCYKDLTKDGQKQA